MTLGEVAYNARWPYYTEDYRYLDQDEREIWERVAEAVRDEVGKQLVRGLIV